MAHVVEDDRSLCSNEREDCHILQAHACADADIDRGRTEEVADVLLFI